HSPPRPGGLRLRRGVHARGRGWSYVCRDEPGGEARAVTPRSRPALVRRAPQDGRRDGPGSLTGVTGLVSGSTAQCRCLGAPDVDTETGFRERAGIFVSLAERKERYAWPWPRSRVRATTSTPSSTTCSAHV